MVDFGKNLNPLSGVNSNTDKSTVPKIIAVGGGKGGIGKTIVSVNLAVSLAWQNKKVILVDADFGGANLHTCLGIQANAPTLTDYLVGRINDLQRALIPTNLPNIRVISGAKESLNIVDVTEEQRTRFVQAARNLDADYIVLDLGAGSTNNVIDFFLTADKGILVMLPEPTSIENVYRFIKVAFYRKMSYLETYLGLDGEIANLLHDDGSRSIKTPSKLLESIKTLKGPGEVLYSEMMKFNPQIIVNMVRTSADIDFGSSVTFACKKYFGISVDYVGHIHYSNCMWQSVRNRKPLAVEFPNSTLVTSFTEISRKLRESMSG